MVILGETNEEYNILHIILGPETENQFNIQGQSFVDITKYIQGMDSSKPCKLLMNPCTSEQYVVDLINQNQLQKKIQNALNPDTSKTKDETHSSHYMGKTVFPKCPSCHAPNKGIEENGMIVPCKTCQEIDAGLKMSKKPTDEKLLKIKNQILKTNKKQKQTLLEYIQNKEVEGDYNEE
jgi:hypothetical protein